MRHGFCYLILLSLLLFTASGARGASVSGTVTNSSGKPDARVYIRVSGSGTPGNLGVSIDAPGAFTIRGLGNGTYQLYAFMDTADTGVRLANSPVGQSQFTIEGGADKPGVNVTLQPPSSITPQQLDKPFGVPCSGGRVFIVWETPEDGDGLQAAEAYNIYWSTNPLFTPGTAMGSLLNIPASDQDFAVVSGLANGSTYYFVMTSEVGGVESSPSDTSDPVTIGTPPGSYTIDGTVSFQGFFGNAARPVNIAAVDEAGRQMRITSATPVSDAASVPFTISGVPNGVYELFAFIDNNDNGYLDPGDYSIQEEESPIVTVNGANVTNVTATITSAPVFASIRTLHWRNMEYGNEGYGLTFEVVQSVKRPVNVAILDGPEISSPIDVGVQDDWGGFSSWLADIDRPTTADDYTFRVYYPDGSYDDLQVLPSDVLDKFATPTSPIGFVSTTLPTFTWSGPDSPPAWYEYRVELNDNNWGRIWETEDELPMGTTQVDYDGSGLTLGTEYIWNIVLSDRRGNYTMYSANFTPIDPEVTKVLTASMAGEGGGSVFVNPPGEYLPHSPFSFDAYTPVTLTAVPGPDTMVNWTGCDSTSDNTCYVTMNADRTVIATFLNYDYRVQLNGVGKPSVQAAFNDAVNGCVIKARGDHFDEGNLVLNTSPGNSVTLKGGYEQTFTTNSGYSYLGDTFTIANGVLTVENIVID